MCLHFGEKTNNLERCANPIIPGEREGEILTFHLTHLDNMTNLYRLPPDKLFIWFITAFEVFPTIKAGKLFPLKTRANAHYVSMLFMALWEDIKTVKPMEVFTWGLQLTNFDFDLRQSFLWRKDTDFIYPVNYFRSVFSMCVVSESQAYKLCAKHLLFSQIKHTQTSMHLHRYSHMLCNVEKISYASANGVEEEHRVSSDVSVHNRQQHFEVTKYWLRAEPDFIHSTVFKTPHENTAL